jgi:hypothetical protein
MFEREITKINSIIIHKICQRYNLDEEEVKQTLSNDLQINFNIIHEDIEQIKIIKKHQPKQSATTNIGQSSQTKMEHDDNKVVDDAPTKDTQCEARVFIASDLIVKQCSRPKLEGHKLCKLHQRLHEEGKLKYGTIHEDKPACISTAKLNQKVRRKIY